MKWNLSNEQMKDIAMKSHQRAVNEENYRLFKDIPHFPFASPTEVQALVKQRKLRLLVFQDADIISKFGNRNTQKLKKNIEILQALVFWAVIITPIVVSITSSNYWILTAIGSGLIGMKTTTPTPQRAVFSILSIILLVVSFFITENVLLKYLFLFFSLANILINLLRSINEGSVLNIIYPNEHAFVWGFLNKAFLIRVLITGDIIHPDLPENMLEAIYKKVYSALHNT